MGYASCKPADALVFVCMVTDFSAAEKARGVKFCMHVGLLSGQIFSPLVNIGSRGVTEAALLPDRPVRIGMKKERKGRVFI